MASVFEKDCLIHMLIMGIRPFENSVSEHFLPQNQKTQVNNQNFLGVEKRMLHNATCERRKL
jgi:hypothetical protein